MWKGERELGRGAAREPRLGGGWWCGNPSRAARLPSSRHRVQAPASAPGRGRAFPGPLSGHSPWLGRAPPHTHTHARPGSRPKASGMGGRGLRGTWNSSLECDCGVTVALVRIADNPSINPGELAIPKLQPPGRLISCSLVMENALRWAWVLWIINARGNKQRLFLRWLGPSNISNTW